MKECYLIQLSLCFIRFNRFYLQLLWFIIKSLE